MCTQTHKHDKNTRSLHISNTHSKVIVLPNRLKEKKKEIKEQNNLFCLISVTEIHLYLILHGEGDKGCHCYHWIRENRRNNMSRDQSGVLSKNQTERSHMEISARIHTEH